MIDQVPTAQLSFAARFVVSRVVKSNVCHRSTYEQVLELAGDIEGHYLPIAGRGLVGLGEIAWEQYDLEAAQRNILEGIELSEKWSRMSAFDGYLSLVQLRLSQGDLPGTDQVLNHLRKMARQFDITEADDLVVDIFEASLNIKRGNLEAVHAWASQRGYEGNSSSRTTEHVDNIIDQRLKKYEILLIARLWLADKGAIMRLLKF